ncbi:MAG: hypothetical protein WC451_03075, partial [Patescibacteria group bacterium]
TLGTHINNRGKAAEKIRILFEIPDQKITVDGQPVPRTVFQDYTKSLYGESHLCKHLISWRSKPFTEAEKKSFDLTTIVKANCLLTLTKSIGNDNKEYVNISGIGHLMKGQTILRPVNNIILYDFEEEGFPIPDFVPDWIQKKIKLSEEYKKYQSGDSDDEGGQAPSDDNRDNSVEDQSLPDDDDDLPF